MAAFRELRWKFIDVFGRSLVWLWMKSCRWKVKGSEGYEKLRSEGRPAVIIVWHGRIFVVPYFFRKRGIMPLVSPSGDGEIVARIMEGWGYKILRGSASHSIVKAWKEMTAELRRGGELIIVPDGPRGPNRILKAGCLKLAQEAGAHLVPFSFSSGKKRVLRSWDRFLMFHPFSRVVAVFGKPFTVAPDLSEEEFEREKRKVEELLIRLDEEADGYFSRLDNNRESL